MKAYFRDLVFAVAETFKVKPPEVAAVFSASTTLVVDDKGETVLSAKSVEPYVPPAPQEDALCINRTYSAPSLSENVPRAIDMPGCLPGEGGWSAGVQTVSTGASMSLLKEAGCRDYIQRSDFVCQPQ